MCARASAMPIRRAAASLARWKAWPRWRWEAAGSEDVHFHPVESRSFRLTLSANF